MCLQCRARVPANPSRIGITEQWPKDEVLGSGTSALVRKPACHQHGPRGYH